MLEKADNSVVGDVGLHPNVDEAWDSFPSKDQSWAYQYR